MSGSRGSRHRIVLGLVAVVLGALVAALLSGAGAPGRGRWRVGKPSFSPIVFRHTYDASSPALARAAAVGQVLRSATITFLTGGQRTARIRLGAVFIVGDKQ
jgi:hypothetical protein